MGRSLMFKNCDRSSGRSRIGTLESYVEGLNPENCDRSSGRSRIGTKMAQSEKCIMPKIAIVLRGDRGLELM